MKNLFLLLAFLLVLPVNISAQSFLDKVLKGVEKTNKILDETDKMLGSDGSSQSSSRRRKVSGFQIISPHPDIEIQFKRCVISGSTAILDLVITNYGKDANIQLGGSSNKVFDDLGINIQKPRSVLPRVECIVGKKHYFQQTFLSNSGCRYTIYLLKLRCLKG